ncbi:MAG TPA: EamA family transporter [Terriglobales bacterium]|nr:EamA family transporter [Terriglobales bacterium]
MTTAAPSRWKVILAFGLVYLFWGSTYLAIAIAVERIPPALMCATRFLIAGILMLFYCGLSGRQVWFSVRQLWNMAVVGTLLLMGGNLTLSYAEKVVPSGLSALLIASTPLWFLILETWMLEEHHIAPRGLAGLGLGIIGMAVLLWPKLMATGTLGRRELWAALSLPLCSFSWALGSVLSKIWLVGEDPFSSTAWQITFAGISNLLFALLAGDPSRVTWTARGLGAVLYLVVGGSWIGYTSYIFLLRNAPSSKVSTYAYVNPLVAVFLGWLLRSEQLDRYILAGTAIIVASVILVTSAKIKTKTVAEEMPAVETAG